MGLQGQLNDVSDSIPLLFLALIAHCIGYLRSFLFNLLHSTPFHPNQAGDEDSSLVVLAEQLNLNRRCSHRFGAEGEDCARAAPDCIVCLSTVRGGEQVRRLACRHVFHKDCFDGWLNQLKFSCPLCRSPLVSDERVASAGRRVGTWLSIR